MSYNGWKNRETWNVALWIGNNEPLYRAARDFVAREVSRTTPSPYLRFLRDAGLENSKTPDGIAFRHDKLAIKELNDMLRELRSDWN